MIDTYLTHDSNGIFFLEVITELKFCDLAPRLVYFDRKSLCFLYFVFPVGVCDQAKVKLTCSATETRWNGEILSIASLVSLRSSERITKALFGLHRFAG